MRTIYFIQETLFNQLPIQEEELTLLKEQINQPLPTAFIQLLQEQNGGYLKNNCLQTTEPTRDGLEYVKIHYLLGTKANNYAPSLFEQQVMRAQWELPDYFFIFAVDETQVFALDYAHLLVAKEPSIRYLDLEVMQWLTVAPTFHDFLAQLYQQEDEAISEQIFTYHQANWYLLQRQFEQTKRVLSVLEDHPDKEWYFTWIKQLAQSIHLEERQFAANLFLTQVQFFHPTLPKQSTAVGQILSNDSDATIREEILAAREDWA
ncbi:SMI1/KNR4 family protein [Isobaculum melis]|uniref:SMI1 / KNR4 family (SUKH-1) n=1 Tax=Isobaculum melis TaxID=142588 RepID=A0A1H9U1Y7_9LACT|nr:SMI1/KNR4 family protein [Isobaculum melis]SES03456.1 SMI1 / KNR4 family (SUKH-1) [Isobaculum melis]